MKNNHENKVKYQRKMKGLDSSPSCPLFDGKHIEQGLCVDILTFLTDYPHEEPYEDHVIDNIIKDNDTDILLIKKLCCNHALFKKYIKQHLYDAAIDKIVDDEKV